MPVRYIVFAGLCVGIVSPAAATIFHNGIVSAGATVTLGAAHDAGTTTGPAMTAVPATISSNASASLQSGNYSAFASHGIEATWASADAGTVDVQWGWIVASAGSGIATAVSTYVTQADWAYVFTATGNGVFTARYSVDGSGTPTPFGLRPIYGGDAIPTGPYGGGILNPNGAGSFSVGLLKDQTYTMRLFNSGNLANPPGFDSAASARALIDWDITYRDPVPEPAGWTLLIAGFGLVGAAARGRRLATV